MIVCTCFIQAGQISEDVERRLREGFDAFTRNAFGEPARINWIPVAKGSGFSAGKPSTSSVVSVRANTPVAQATRVNLLQELSNLWNTITGCSLDELLVVVADPENK
jgi:hypothetical protein